MLFTDDSKMENRVARACVTFKNGREIGYRKIRLIDEVSNFMAEDVAVKEAFCYTLTYFEDTRVNIISKLRVCISGDQLYKLKYLILTGY